jgi:hypothetical protein
MDVRAIVKDFRDNDLTHKLFPEIKALGGIVFGVALTLCFGDISHTTAEFAADPSLWRILDLVLRPLLVLAAWYYFMRTLAYNTFERTQFFYCLVLALVAAVIAEFGLSGLPFLPTVEYYKHNPQAIHLAELATYAYAAFFAFIAFANAINWGKAVAGYMTMQARGTCVNCACFAVCLGIIATALVIGNMIVWVIGLALIPSTFIASISLRSSWRAKNSFEGAA